MLYYLILLVIYFVLGFRELSYPVEKNRGIYTFLLLLPMFILAALRSLEIGNDTIVYYYAFEQIDEHMSFLQVVRQSRLESGYLLLCYCCCKLGLSFLGLQILVSFIIYAGLFYGLRKYSVNIAFCCFYFIASLRMGATMNIVRMFLAISVLIYATKFILERKFLRFCLLVAIACTFHKSAFVFFVMYPLCVIKKNRFVISGVVLSAIVIMYLGSTFFTWMTDTLDMYEGYVTEERFENMNMLAVTFTLLTTLAILFFAIYSQYFNMPQYEIKNNAFTKSITFEYFNQMAMYIVLAMSIIGLSNNIMSRIAGYFSIFNMFLLASCFNLVKSTYSKIALYVGFSLFYFAYFMIVLTYRSNWNHIVPYRFFFEL